MITHTTRTRLSSFFLVFFLTVGTVATTRAADTVETWDVGATDVDLYVGFDGIGLDGSEQVLYGDIMFGYGLVERFSAYLGTTLEGSDYLSTGSASIYFGVFGTAIDTDHFDCDLFLDFSAADVGHTEFGVTPAIELNFDVLPDLASWGAFLRSGVPISGDVTASPDGAEGIEHELTADIETTLGMYWTVQDDHQLIWELDATFVPSAGDQENSTNVGGVALGYNVCLTAECGLEMINNVYLDVPQNEENLGVGVSTGLIATVP